MRSANLLWDCLLIGVDRKWRFEAVRTVFDPTRTSGLPPNAEIVTG
jgi:hypothetical protein